MENYRVFKILSNDNTISMVTGDNDEKAIKLFISKFPTHVIESCAEATASELNNYVNEGGLILPPENFFN